jgi:F0F1-type ATP synthase assembly protein I
MPDEPERLGKEDFDEIERELQKRLEELGLDKDQGAPETDEEPPELRLRADVPEPGDDEEIHRRMEAMRQKIAAAGNRSMPEPPEWNFKRPTIPGQERRDATSYIGLGVGLSVAYTMIGAIVLGWGLGKLIDVATHGQWIGQTIGTLLGAVIGLAGGIFMIDRAQNKQDSQKK